MNQYEREKLVVLISSGHNLYQDIHRKLPSITDDELRYDEENLIKMVDQPEEYVSYQFQPNDQFILTDAGESLLYQVRKDCRRERETIISIILSAIAAATGVIALIY